MKQEQGECKKMKRAVILQKPSGTIAIGGNMNLKERKFYDVFLKVAKETLKNSVSEDWFSVSLPELKKFLGVEEDLNNKRIKTIIKRMHKIDIEYNVLGKDQEIEGYSSILNDIEFIKNRKTDSTIIKFSLPKRVRLAMIKKNGMYASIKLVIIQGLRSKYSLILYELAEDYKKVEIPKMTMEQFRNMFGLYREKDGKEEKKYPKMPDLRRAVLDNACNEINRNSNVDFEVSYKLEKHGKEYTHIKFIVKRNKKLEKKLNFKRGIPELPEQKEEKTDDETLQKLPELPAKYRTDAAKRLINEYKSKGIGYIEAQICYTNNSNARNYLTYLRKALESNYAQADVGNDRIKKTNEEISRLNEKYKDQYLYINNKSMKFEYISGQDGMLKLFAYDKEKSILCGFNMGKDLEKVKNKLSGIEKKTHEERKKRRKMLQEGMASKE